MNDPLFSIVIPTKNRSFLVGPAIRSILAQTHRDYEIVVIDNDDTDATHQVVAAFVDKRVRYVRTGGLKMEDNWDRAFREARGRYIILLEDKSVLFAHALERIAQAIESEEPELISWLQDTFDDRKVPPQVYRPPRTGEVRVYSAVEALRVFVDDSRWESDQILPRGMNSCLSRDLYPENPSRSLRSALSADVPDYTMAFQQLAFADRLVHINDALTVFGSCRHSHGIQAQGKTASKEGLGHKLGVICEELDLVPLKVVLIASCLWNDYLSMQKRVGGNLKKLGLNPANFFVECFRDIERAESLGQDMSFERKMWNEALGAQPASVKSTVEARLNPKTSLLKTIWRTSGVGPTVNKILGRAPAVPLAPKALPNFSDALAYVQWSAGAESVEARDEETETRKIEQGA